MKCDKCGFEHLTEDQLKDHRKAVRSFFRPDDSDGEGVDELVLKAFVAGVEFERRNRKSE